MREHHTVLHSLKGSQREIYEVAWLVLKVVLKETLMSHSRLGGTKGERRLKTQQKEVSEVIRESKASTRTGGKE